MSFYECEVYLYDTLARNSEKDDPLNAIVYSRGSEANLNSHILVMAGQLVGVTQIFTDAVGGFPSLVRLRHGKGTFLISKYGRFILLLGDLRYRNHDKIDDNYDKHYYYYQDECRDERRLKSLKDEIENALFFYRGAGFDTWFIENPFKFREKCHKFMNRVLSHSVFVNGISDFEEVALEDPDLVQSCRDVVLRSMKQHRVFTGGVFHKGKFLYHNVPAKIYAKLKILMENIDRSEDITPDFCKPYRLPPESRGLPVGSELYSVYLTAREMEELKSFRKIFLKKAELDSKKKQSYYCDVTRVANALKDLSTVVSSNSTEENREHGLMFMKVDLAVLVLIMEVDCNVIRQIWSLGLTKLPGILMKHNLF